MDATNHSNIRQSVSVIPMFIIGTLFFVFGFVTWLNGSLIPFLKIACELNHMEAYFVTMAFYIAYTVMALPMAFVLKRTGYKNGMMLGLLVMAIGSLIFIPAANERMFSIFLFGLFMLGTGLTILQTAANPYIVLLGPEESAAVRISIMGLLNKGAGVVAPIIFTAFILGNMGQFDENQLAALNDIERNIQLNELAQRLADPYLIMAATLIVLAIFIKLSPLPAMNSTEKKQDGKQDNDNDSIFAYPQLILGVVTLFLYVGVEVIAGDTIGLFGQELGVENFGQLTSYTMAFMVLAYIVGMFSIPRFIKQESALMLSAVLGLLLTFLIMITPKDSAVVWSSLIFWQEVGYLPDVVLYVALLGFANALVWPAVWPMALSGLGKHIETGSALLIMGISGGAILPLAYGALTEVTSNSQSSYMVMLPCYLFILFYALKGHKVRHWNKQSL
ncbi:sugar MFS transporter [Colwellia sp. 1_MG-2023]|uniref:sugar MFS transporter n=1 Tax=unclassified Colwellia TaxID=196834 RepID=UPI002090D6F2|nr:MULTISPECIES: sugar MFS transporter [unclassified Colwellia]MDO6651733.1 sugar MFS transporter [Colwellia sp. 3_MG-2023]MDO6665356.1 sugar MFS transporter [Colwellia sp. 2_MG-2023]MDO6689729.1 sugar MFS transporter [Colwellia sp. 1_MG-2023]